MMQWGSSHSRLTRIHWPALECVPHTFRLVSGHLAVVLCSPIYIPCKKSAPDDGISKCVDVYKSFNIHSPTLISNMHAFIYAFT